MDLELAGCRVLVTAGASGIGLETAQAFLGEGARVHVCDIDAEAVKALQETHDRLTASTGDVADREECATFVDDAIQILGGLDVLVNNAGISGPTGRVDEILPEEWDATLAVNITGQFNCARLAIPHLKTSRNASIINMSSAAGRLAFPFRAPYAASKWASVGFTKTLARELGPFGIRVNAILPGPVAGERIDRVIEANAAARGMTFEEGLEDALSRVSLGEFVTPRQIADAIVFLCSPRGRTISGASVCIDSDKHVMA